MTPEYVVNPKQEAESPASVVSSSTTGNPPADTDVLAGMPEAIKVKEFKLHPSIDQEEMEKHELLYKGGKEFRKECHRFIIKRQIEKMGKGQEMFQARRERAWYINRGGGLINWLVASITKEGVSARPSKEKEDDHHDFVEKSNTEYWPALTEDATGIGCSLTAVASDGLRDLFKHNRAYFFADAGIDLGDGTSKKHAPAIRNIPVSAVGDWQNDDNGKLMWVRLDMKKQVRSTPWASPDTCEYYWTFVTPFYTYVYKWREDKKKTPDEDALAVLVASEPHDFGALPIAVANGSTGTYIMDQIADLLIATFNRELSTTWALDQLAYAMLVFMVENTDLNNLEANEWNAVKVGSQEKAEFVSPKAEIFQPLFDDIERLKRGLYEVLQAAALTAASETQNARQSTTAKALDQELLHTLLRSYAEPVKGALTELVRAVAAFRDEEPLNVIVVGLDKFDAKLEEIQELLAGGMGAAESDPVKKQAMAKKKDAEPEEKE